MKIGLFIDADYTKAGGVQEYLKGLYDFLSKRGHEVYILTKKSERKFEDKRKVIEIGKSLPIKYPGTSASMYLNWADQTEIEEVFNQHSFDVLHLMAPFGPLGFQLLEKSPALNVATYHVVVEKSLQPFVLRSLTPLISSRLKKLHGCIAISEIAKNYAEKIFPAKYEVIPLGVDIKRFNPQVPKIENFKKDKINILFAGRLDKRKGLRYLLRAYKELSEKQPNLKLSIVGTGPLEKSLKESCLKKELKNITFFGYVDDEEINRYYTSADIFCSPATTNETFGEVILEAMASGLPIVAFANLGYENVFGELLKGFIVKNKSVDALVQALMILIKNEKFRKEIGSNNRKIAQKMFAWEVVGESILDFYNKKLLQSKDKSV